MLGNCALWADNPTALILVCIAAGIVIIGMPLMFFAEVDEPDNSLKLASMHGSKAVSKTAFETMFKALQHVDMGVTSDNKTYVGLRFWF
jgi:hypothetical protein